MHGLDAELRIDLSISPFEMKAFGLLALAGIIFPGCFCREIVFEGCDKAGFSCQKNSDSGEEDISFECQPKDTAPVINIWKFAGRKHVGQLSIKNCDGLKLSFACGSARNINSLFVKNVRLQITPGEKLCYPKSITFETVNVDTIPSKAFTGPQLESILLENSVINIMEPKAFESLSNLKTFRIKTSNVNTIRGEAVHFACSSDCNFEFYANNIAKLEPRALKFDLPEALIGSNSLSSVSAEAFRGTYGKFEFQSNSVTTMHADAFALSAGDAKFVTNYFANLYSGAFRQVEPGTAAPKSGKGPSYSFERNSITYSNPDSFSPNTSAYNKAHGSVSIANNNVQCSCKNFATPLCKNSLVLSRDDVCKTNY